VGADRQPAAAGGSAGDAAVKSAPPPVGKAES